MTKWEYKVAHLYFTDTKTTQEFLNREGQDGWECFAVKLDVMFYFKRQANKVSS